MPNITNASGSTCDGIASLFVEWNMNISNNDTFQVEVNWIDKKNNQNITMEFSSWINKASVAIEHGSENVTERFRVSLKGINVCNETSQEAIKDIIGMLH